MNIKVHTVIRDITGKTGCSIIEAILNGERKAENCLLFVDTRIKATKATIIASLEGNFRKEHLFTLEQSYRFYRFYQQQIACCDAQIQAFLQSFEVSRDTSTGTLDPQEEPKAVQKKKKKNTPSFDIRKHLKSIHGVDVVATYGMSEVAAGEVLGETGTDQSKWPNEKHFVSWLNLCPNNKIPGGKLISSTLLKKKPNSASQAFRSAANVVQRSDHWLGDYFRSMKEGGQQIRHSGHRQ